MCPYYFVTMIIDLSELSIKQTIETDVAMAATTFSIGVSTYLVICNYGNVRRYETKSRLYRVNPHSSLLVVNWRIANL